MGVEHLSALQEYHSLALCPEERWPSHSESPGGRWTRSAKQDRGDHMDWERYDGRTAVVGEETDCDYWLLWESTGLKCGRATLWQAGEEE